MSLTKEEVLDAISQMSVMDIVQLISMMEEKFGVSASSSAFSVSEKSAEIKPEEEPTEFNVLLTKIGVNKISVIKTVRSIVGLGLKEAKDLVESSPVILKKSINKDDAYSLKKTLEEIGASVEIQPV